MQNFNLPSLKNKINMPNLGDTKDKGEDVANQGLFLIF